jgi:hypothetical protein
MRHLRIVCLLLISSGYFITACTPAYKKMQLATADVKQLSKFKPSFNVALYNTQVDVVGNHLSGLLLVKKMPDSSTRMVFSNEMGFKFFDFEFSADGNFKVHSIIKKMNKKAVLKTLRHDFELVLMQHTDNPVSIRQKDEFTYYVFAQQKGYNYYITDSTGNTLVKIERASNKKTIVDAIMKNYSNGIPDTIGISHKTFSFTIGLKKLERNATQ